MPPLTAKKLPKIGKKEEKLGRKGKNWEVSLVLTDRTGYATAESQKVWKKIQKLNQVPLRPVPNVQEA